MITVLMLCEHFGGAGASLHGVSRTFQWQLPLVDPSGFRMLLCSRKGYDKAAGQMIASGLAPLYLGYGKMDPRNLAALLRLVREERVDIIHAHGFGACLWARLAGYVLPRPVIVHGRANYGTVPMIMRPVERLLGPRTRYALAVSESTRQYMIHQRHIPAHAVEVLYNGILLDDVKRLAQSEIAALRTDHGIGPDDKVIGVVGRIVGHKGHLDAFRALQTVRRSRPRVRLWVVGDGDFLPTLREWVAAHKMEEHIRFLGFRRDVLNVIQCFDVQLFPSHLEGTPNTLFEALAVGNCIVATPVDGQGEILVDGETALMYPTGRSDELAQRIERVLGDDALADRLRAAARARSLAFDGRKCVAALENTYRRIMTDYSAEGGATGRRS